MDARNCNTLQLSGSAVHEDASPASSTRCYLLSIPLEILRCILEFALLTGELPKLAVTCRVLNLLATEILYRTVNINTSFSGFFINQIESLLSVNHPGLQLIKRLMIQDLYNSSDHDRPEGLHPDELARLGRPVMEMHLRLLLRRLKPGQLREFHILTHREGALKNIPRDLLDQLAQVKHLSLSAEIFGECDWMTYSETGFREVESLRLTNICRLDDFVLLWKFLEKNSSSLDKLYISGIYRHTEITWDLASLVNEDPVFRTNLSDILPKLQNMRTDLHLANLRCLRIRRIASLQILREVSCNHVFNLQNLQMLRLDSCLDADSFILEIARGKQAPNLRSLQLFDSCHSDTLREAIPMMQPLETLYLCPSYPPRGSPKPLSLNILDNHKGSLRRIRIEDHQFPILAPNIGAAGSRVDLSVFLKVEEIAIVIGKISRLDCVKFPVTMRLLRILDLPYTYETNDILGYVLLAAKNHVAHSNGRKPALSVVSVGSYRHYIDIQECADADDRLELLVGYERDEGMGWNPVLTEVETKALEEKHPEFDIVHEEAPEGVWQPV
ncbi:hypothetical protein TWF481_006541 [Arthrobotrys musiformis]|uniref:F-box domain-containing protein n=1 Tax=Arthrobotrys musiformis TaxID=47236 RepID=A0AAV9WEJ6_9PEZI